MGVGVGVGARLVGVGAGVGVLVGVWVAMSGELVGVGVATTCVGVGVSTAMVGVIVGVDGASVGVTATGVSVGMGVTSTFLPQLKATIAKAVPRTRSKTQINQNRLFIISSPPVPKIAIAYFRLKKNEVAAIRIAAPKPKMTKLKTTSSDSVSGALPVLGIPTFGAPDGTSAAGAGTVVTTGAGVTVIVVNAA